jgi:hypothetical protein
MLNLELDLTSILPLSIAVEHTVTELCFYSGYASMNIHTTWSSMSSVSCAVCRSVEAPAAVGRGVGRGAQGAWSLAPPSSPTPAATTCSAAGRRGPSCPGSGTDTLAGVRVAARDVATWRLSRAPSCQQLRRPSRWEGDSSVQAHWSLELAIR